MPTSLRLVSLTKASKNIRNNLTHDDKAKAEKHEAADTPIRRVSGRFELDVPEPQRNKEKIEREKEPYFESLKNDFRRRVRKTNFILEIFGAILIFGYATIAALQWSAMNQANIQNADNFVASQRPYVSIGKRDGTIGAFVDPLDAKGKAAVVLYFHNGGNLPASGFNVRLFVVPTPYRDYHMARLRNRTMDLTVYLGGLKDIARDSDNTELFPNLYSQADVMSARAGSKTIALNGFFEYCDAFGEYVCRDFTIGFDAPTNGFDLLSIKSCGGYEYPLVNPQLPADLEYVSPCPNPNEQKREQGQTEHYIEIGRPPPIPAWHAPSASATSTQQ